MYKLELEYIKYDENMTSSQRRELEHRVAYGLLFKLLLSTFGIFPTNILKNENGKPYVENEGVHFSLSHTRGLAACVVSDSPVGVDCERLTYKSPEEIKKFANRFFVENEISLLDSGGYTTLDFYKIWTAKEATVKKQGSNMSQVKKIDTTQENILVSLENDYIISINI